MSGFVTGWNVSVLVLRITLIPELYCLVPAWPFCRGDQVHPLGILSTVLE